MGVDWKSRNERNLVKAHAARIQMWVELLNAPAALEVLSPKWLGRHSEEARHATGTDQEQWAASINEARKAYASGQPIDRELAQRVHVLDKDDRLSLLVFREAGRDAVPRRAFALQTEWVRRRIEIVMDNATLIRMMAVHWAPEDVSREEAIEAGERGATKAVDRFDFKRNASYSKVASLWIRHEVTRPGGTRKHRPVIVGLDSLRQAVSLSSSAPVAAGEGHGRHQRGITLEASPSEYAVLESARDSYAMSLGHLAPIDATRVLGELLSELCPADREAIMAINDAWPGRKVRKLLLTLRKRLRDRGVTCAADLLA